MKRRRRKYGRAGSGGGSLWDIYITGPKGRREEDAVTHIGVLFEGTHPSDGGAVAGMAARRYKVPESRVLALPHRGPR